MNEGALALTTDVGAVVENVVDEVVPQTILAKVDQFSQTWAGNVIVTAAFILAVTLLTMLAVRLVNGFFRKTVRRMLSAGNSNATAFSYLRYLALVLIYFTGFSIVVSSIPFLDSGLSRLFAAGGVLAVVVGFASQQAMGTLISGLMILTFKPFAIGDAVRVVSSEVTGTVEEITLRHTIIRTIENKRAIIPNDIMNSAIIENANHTDEKACVLLDISIAPEADIDRAINVFSKVVLNHPQYLDNRSAAEKEEQPLPVVVRTQDLTQSAVILRAQLWAKDSATVYVMRSEVLKEMKEQCAKEQIPLAYPRVVVTEKVSK